MLHLLAVMPLKRKLLLVIVMGTFLSILVAALAVLIYETSTFRPRIASQLEAVTHVMADVNQAALEFNDATQAAENLSFLSLYEGIDAGVLYQNDGSIFATWNARGKGVPIVTPATAPSAGVQHEIGRASMSLPVMRDERLLGHIWVNVTLPPLIQRLPQYGIMFGALALAVLVLGAVLWRAMQGLVCMPLLRLSVAAEDVGQTGNYAVRVQRSSSDEIGQLTDEFNRMLTVIGDRDAALQQAQDHLEQRVEERSHELEQAMTLLMQREKLAALGNVVAGVAHELNTPIGNALLTATSLNKGTQEMRQQMTGNSLGRRDLEDFVTSVEVGASIVYRSLERAAALVRSFKSVAVNETSEARMDFDLQQVLDDCVALLIPGMKHRPITVELDCPSGIRCNSYPGALTQIVSNLVENAARHGLEPTGGGTVHIKVQSKNEDPMLILTVSDQGVGIPPEHLRRVFEPFFTTRLGQGGSGLGLHVVHSLAKGPLGGSIEVHSTVGMGTTFELRFPTNAPMNQL
jgi:signal transduction histidine kinase